jgi:cellulose synthase/poly-beta-1,6-N-acetylglucosamine synthase-like glycosyltransferase
MFSVVHPRHSTLASPPTYASNINSTSNENSIIDLNDNTPKICLNMIVKNESKVILRLLYSVLPLIDGYCICDTGSTDNTIELIESFMK